MDDGQQPGETVFRQFSVCGTWRRAPLLRPRHRSPASSCASTRATTTGTSTRRQDFLLGDNDGSVAYHARAAGGSPPR